MLVLASFLHQCQQSNGVKPRAHCCRVGHIVTPRQVSHCVSRCSLSSGYLLRGFECNGSSLISIIVKPLMNAHALKAASLLDLFDEFMHRSGDSIFDISCPSKCRTAVFVEI